MSSPQVQDFLARLCEFLCISFSQDELVWLMRGFPGLEHSLPDRSAPLWKVAQECCDLLERHGVLDTSEIFHRLYRARPRRKRQINELYEHWSKLDRSDSHSVTSALRLVLSIDLKDIGDDDILRLVKDLKSRYSDASLMIESVVQGSTQIVVVGHPNTIASMAREIEANLLRSAGGYEITRAETIETYHPPDERSAHERKENSISEIWSVARQIISAWFEALPEGAVAGAVAKVRKRPGELMIPMIQQSYDDQRSRFRALWRMWFTATFVLWGMIVTFTIAFVVSLIVAGFSSIAALTGIGGFLSFLVTLTLKPHMRLLSVNGEITRIETAALLTHSRLLAAAQLREPAAQAAVMAEIEKATLILAERHLETMEVQNAQAHGSNR